MQLANGLGIALPGVVSEPSEQDDTQLVKTSQQGDQDAFATWLYRIAYHCCLRQLERRKRERDLQAVVQGEQILEGMNKEKRVEDILELRDRQAVVREQLEQLPTKYRMALILRHLQEMSYEEMAAILSMPAGTIKTHLFRARNLLKERLLAQRLCVPEPREQS